MRRHYAGPDNKRLGDGRVVHGDFTIRTIISERERNAILSPVRLRTEKRLFPPTDASIESARTENIPGRTERDDKNTRFAPCTPPGRRRDAIVIVRCRRLCTRRCTDNGAWGGGRTRRRKRENEEDSSCLRDVSTGASRGRGRRARKKIPLLKKINVF